MKTVKVVTYNGYEGEEIIGVFLGDATTKQIYNYCNSKRKKKVTLKIQDNIYINEYYAGEKCLSFYKINTIPIIL